MPVDPRVRAGCDPANHATLACRVSALKDYDYACARGLDPSLQTNKLDLELRKLLLELRFIFVDDAFSSASPCLSFAMLQRSCSYDSVRC